MKPGVVVIYLGLIYLYTAYFLPWFLMQNKGENAGFRLNQGQRVFDYYFYAQIRCSIDPISAKIPVLIQLFHHQKGYN